MAKTDPATMSATQMLAAFRRRALSPVEVMTATLGRIEGLNPLVAAYSRVDPEAALAAARASEARWMRNDVWGALDGVPLGVKDLVHLAGLPTRRGSHATASDPVPGDDAPSVARLRAQGAIPLGKTTVPEFGWKALGDSPLSGAVRNPWGLGRTPGGSSGGAAVAAALGMGPLQVGTDGGGSIRVPAAFCGVFGLKPSQHRVALAPPSAVGTLAHIGPMTRTVGDAALMLTAMAGPDPRDWRAMPQEPPDYRIGLDDGVRGLRVAFAPAFGRSPVDPRVLERVRGAVGVLQDLGAVVEPAAPDLSDAPAIFEILWSVGMAVTLEQRAGADRARMDPGLVRVAERGAAVSAVDVGQAEYARAELAQRLWAFHRRYDLLVTPQLPLTAFPLGRDVADPGNQRDWWEWTPFTPPFNLTHQPAASMPCGFVDGLPAAIQIVGRWGEDHLVLRAARAIESALPIRLPDEPVP